MHASFWLRFGLVLFGVLALLVPDQTQRPALQSATILLALLVWTAGLYVLVIRRGVEVLNRGSLMAADLLIAFAPFAWAGGFQNVFVCATYGPIVTAAALGGVRRGTALGLAAAVLYVLALWAGGLDPNEIETSGLTTLVATYSLAHVAWGFGTGAFVQMVERLTSRGRSVAEAEERQAVLQELNDRILGHLAAAAIELADPERRRTSQLADVATTLRRAEDESRCTLRQLSTPPPPDDGEGSERSGSLLLRLERPLGRGPSEPSEARGEPLLLHTAFGLRFATLGMVPLAFAAGDPPTIFTAERALLFAGLVVWTLLLYSIALRRGPRALRSPPLLVADLVTVFGAFAMTDAGTGAFQAVTIGPVILAGAVWSLRIACAATAASIAAYLALVGPVVPFPDPVLGQSAISMVVWSAWMYAAWGVGYATLSFVVVRMDARAMALARADERERLLQQLHDRVLGHLSAAVIAVSDLAERPDGYDEDVSVIARQLRESVTDARRSLWGSADTSATAAPDAMAAVVRDFQALIPSRSIELSCGPGAESIDAGVGSHLAAIAREAISNSLRHALAGPVQVRLGAPGEEAILEVRDPGTARSGQAEPRDGLGRRGMLHRAELIGARIDFRSDANGGYVRVILGRDPTGSGLKDVRSAPWHGVFRRVGLGPSRPIPDRTLG